MFFFPFWPNNFDERISEVPINNDQKKWIRKIKKKMGTKMVNHKP